MSTYDSIRKHLQLLSDDIKLRESSERAEEAREEFEDIQNRLFQLIEELDNAIKYYLPSQHSYWEAYGLAQLKIIAGSDQYASRAESINDLIAAVDEEYEDDNDNVIEDTLNEAGRDEEFLWKALRQSKHGGIDVVGFREMPEDSVLAGQTITVFIDNYDTEEEALAAHPDAEEGGYVNKFTIPPVSLNHLPDDGDSWGDEEWGDMFKEDQNDKSEDSNEDLKKEYIDALKQHDWTYDFSDDHRSYLRGHAQREHLRKLRPVVDPDYELWNQYAPSLYKV